MKWRENKTKIKMKSNIKEKMAKKREKTKRQPIKENEK